MNLVRWGRILGAFKHSLFYEVTERKNSRCVMAKSVNKLNWKNQSRWFSHLDLFFYIVPRIFPLVLWKQVVANLRGLKNFTINGQYFFNPINAIPREINTPTGVKGDCQGHPLKYHSINRNCMLFHSEEYPLVRINIPSYHDLRGKGKGSEDG